MCKGKPVFGPPSPRSSRRRELDKSATRRGATNSKETTLYGPSFLLLGQRSEKPIWTLPVKGIATLDLIFRSRAHSCWFCEWRIAVPEAHVSAIFDTTVCAEIITELIPERAGPVIFKTFLLELIAFGLIPVICPARGVKPENYWKR